MVEYAHKVKSICHSIISFHLVSNFNILTSHFSAVNCRANGQHHGVTPFKVKSGSLLSPGQQFLELIVFMNLTRIFHELLAATTDMAVLPGVLGCRYLRRTVQVRLGTNPAVPRDELPGGTPIFVVSRQQFMKYPG
jgi:hypothetical protein